MQNTLSNSTHQEVSMSHILDFIKGATGVSCSSHSDLYLCGLQEESLSDLMTNFFKEFHVDSSQYLWYFHNRLPGLNIGADTKFPAQRVVITPQLLLNSAKSKQWCVEYPQHSSTELTNIQYSFFKTGLILILLLTASALLLWHL